MSDPLKAFLQSTALETPAFSADSRYHGLEIAQWARADGQVVPYVRRRFVPPPARFATVAEHLVASGDRLDNLAARYLGDPQQYWRICDANGAIRPDDLVATPGRRLSIGVPDGTPGGGDG